MKSLTLLALLIAAAGPVLSFAAKPNILFIAIDDQNDWVGHLGGHPMAKTPHLDRLAARGTTFLNAHCQSPLCNPSRTSLLLSLRPTTTGIYGLSPWFRTLPDWKDRVTLPQYFADHGYRTAATGKIFHAGTGAPGAGAGKGKAKASAYRSAVVPRAEVIKVQPIPQFASEESNPIQCGDLFEGFNDAECSHAAGCHRESGLARMVSRSSELSVRHDLQRHRQPNVCV